MSVLVYHSRTTDNI